MAYLAPIHKPSSVRHALTLSFTSPDSLDLIIAKSNRLEIWSPSPTNPSELIHLHTKTIYGKITLLAKLRPAQSSTDHLFIGTDRNNYFTLSWSPSTSTLKTEKAFHDIADKSARDSQTGDRVHIDPTNRFLTLECYEGVITVLPIAHAGKGKRKQSLGQQQDIGELGTPIPVRIPELFVKSTCFIHNRTTGLKPANPEIAILYEDSGSQRMRIKVRELEYSASLRNEEPGSAELEKVREVQGDVEVGAGFLIPLPGPVYGFLVVGETGVGYVDEWEFRVQRTEALEEATVFVAWCGIDDQRYVLADDYGKMYLLLVQQDSRGEYAGHRIDNLGYTSRASTLVYLDEGRVFVGSHQGDSQIIQISEQGLEVLQTFPNIAPILDFTVMDMGNRSSDAPVNEFSSGQARLVTGSGAFKDGSLRSVRSGVGLEDVGSIGDMGAPVSTIFSLRSGRRGMQGVDTLVVGFVSHTRVFVFDEEGEVEEVEDFRGFQLSESTLHAGSLDDGRAVQVTTSAVTLSDAEGGVVTDTWHPSTNQTITAVSAVGSSILLSLNDNNNTALVSLDISTPTIQVRAARHFDANEQISCLTTSASTPGVAVVGFWSDALVAFLSLSKLETITETSVADPTSSSSDDSVAVPRSLIIANILPQQPPTLFVGLADGNVVTYTLIPSTSSSSLLSQAPTFWNRKSIILGTQQPNFALLPRGDGLENVFATCEHPSLIYGSEGRMVYSAVTAESAAAICAFDSAASPGAIAIASTSDSGETELKLAVVDEERTTHVQTLPVHETVRRIAYSPDLRAFGLGTIKRTLEAGEEIVESHFKLVDEVAFQELHTYALGRDELVECVMRCKLDDGVGGEAERFVVGTAFLDDAEAGGAANGKAVRGRILVFEVTESRELKVIEELGLRGACRCLGIAGGGRIVAALVKTVVIYAFEYQTPSSPLLVKKAAYRTATAPIDLAVTSSGNGTDSVIAVTDLMKSVSLLQHTCPRGKSSASASSPQDTLEEIARHFDTLWGTAVACVADNTYLAADAEGNLVVLQHDLNGFSTEDRRRLRVTSEMLLGEMVNRIRRISIQPTPNAIVIPRAFCATVEGGVYLFALIAPGQQDFLIRLQERMAELETKKEEKMLGSGSAGGVTWRSFRGFKSGTRDMGEEGPMRFVDGELVERFLDLGEEEQGWVCEGLPGGRTVENVRGVVEGLRRVH